MAPMWLGPFSLNEKMTWVSYFQLDHAIWSFQNWRAEHRLETQKSFESLASNFTRLASWITNYADVTGTSQLWHTVVERWTGSSWAIEIWDHICQPCTCWQWLPKSKWPSSQSYLTLQSATKDPLILAKLYFFSYIAGTIKPFLTEYQYTKPMMSFTYDDLRQLLRDIVSKYIKSETMEKCKNASILLWCQLQGCQKSFEE